LFDDLLVWVVYSKTPISTRHRQMRNEVKVVACGARLVLPTLTSHRSKLELEFVCLCESANWCETPFARVYAKISILEICMDSYPDDDIIEV